MKISPELAKTLEGFWSGTLTPLEGEHSGRDLDLSMVFEIKIRGSSASGRCEIAMPGGKRCFPITAESREGAYMQITCMNRQRTFDLTAAITGSGIIEGKVIFDTGRIDRIEGLVFGSVRLEKK